MLNRPKKKKSGLNLGGLQNSESPSLIHRKQRIQRVVLVLVLFVLVAAVTRFPEKVDSSGQYDIDAETIASQKIHAMFAFESEDLEATRLARENAASQEMNTYSINKSRVENQLVNLQQRITYLQEQAKELDSLISEALMASDSSMDAEVVINTIVGEFIQKFMEDPGAKGLPESIQLQTWLAVDIESAPKRIFVEESTAADAEAERRAVLELSHTNAVEFRWFDALSDISQQGLEYILLAGVKKQGVSQSTNSVNAPENMVVLRQPVVGDLKVSEVLPYVIVPDPMLAQDRLRSHLAAIIEQRFPDAEIVWPGLKESSFAMASGGGISDTLQYDQLVTEGNRALAYSDVEPIMKRFFADQVLQEEGYKWTPQSKEDVRTYWAVAEIAGTQTVNWWRPVLSNFVFIALILLALERIMPVVTRKRTDAYKSFNVLLLITASIVVISRVMMYFEPTGLMVPVAAGGILLTILTGARVASMGTVIMVLMVSLLYNQDWKLLVVLGAMSLTGIVSIYTVRKRGDMANAAVRSTVIGWLMVLATSLAIETVDQWEIFRFLAFVTLNGIICLFVVPGLLSPLERLFGITTDIQLLEYSDLNNELLGRLAIEVPATYAHSLMMGQMAEAACDAIGANGLLARVCAYYHDIGKLRRPEYFSENQMGYNVHDDLSPRLSARAISSHITEGVEMARDYYLPQPIIRGILEHHGTLLISFFYQHALDQQKHGDVREEDYRYPGPKPQSRETAVLMICDAVESGVRSIKNPNEERIRDFIDKIIQSRSADRQFDECDLTLKQLDTISEILTRIIITAHHTRVAYPDQDSAESESNVIPIQTGTGEQ
jgi:putative nucleotidyltransferase with HDIG domain